MSGAAPPDVSPPPSALDTAQIASSGMMKLNIDQWSGSFASQRRRRVEMMISPSLRELDQLLKVAENRLKEALDAVDADVSWAGPQDRLLHAADQQLSEALKLILTIRDDSSETLYTFIGLQLSEIADTHLIPAKDSIYSGLQADENSARRPPVESAWQQTTRARQRLNELTAQFDRIRREHALADAVEEVRNMYMVFVEESYELMNLNREDINNYQRRMAQFEVDEEYLERLREVLEMRAKLIAEFARILSKDPRLLRRFIDSINGQAESLRDQLTLLTLRQQSLGAQVQAWHKLEPELRQSALAGVIRNRLKDSIEIAQTAAHLQEDFDTWSPLNPDETEEAVAAARQKLAGIAASARDLESKAAAWKVSPRRNATADSAEPEADSLTAERPADEEDSLPPLREVLQHSQQLTERLQQLDTRLMELSARSNDPSAGPFFVRRLADTRRLIDRVTAWSYQLEQLEQENYHTAASVDQHDIAMKTNELTANLANLEQRIAGVLQRPDGTLPADIAELSRQLLKTLDEQVAPAQLGAVFSLRRNRLPDASRRTTAAVESMVRAEELFDQLIKRTIEEADQLPVQDPIAALLDDPTLDELLALLENEPEIDLAALLGIPARPSNLQTMGGFINQRVTDGGFMAMGALNGPPQSLRQAGRRAVNRAQAEIKDLSRNQRQIEAWNVLASELEDRLRQGQGQLPPEEYRRAIEQYFEELSRRAADSQEPIQ